MYTTIQPKLLGSSFIYLFHLYTTIQSKSGSFLLFNLFTYNCVNILYATFMAVLIYFVHYIHGSTDLIFRTLHPWLYEVFAKPTRKTCFSREKKRLAPRIYLSFRLAFLWCQRTFYCILMGNMYKTGESIWKGLITKAL